MNTSLTLSTTVVMVRESTCRSGTPTLAERSRPHRRGSAGSFAAAHAPSSVDGPALLQGLVVCGRCGERMGVRYHKRGKQLRPIYICQRLHHDYAGPICQQVPVARGRNRPEHRRGLAAGGYAARPGGRPFSPAGVGRLCQGGRPTSPSPSRTRPLAVCGVTVEGWYRAGCLRALAFNNHGGRPYEVPADPLGKWLWQRNRHRYQLLSPEQMEAQSVG
jgi:hypothetical protein